MPCPLGTFKVDAGAASVDECTPCTEGYACGQTALTAPDLDCDPGYFCFEGCDTSQPTGADYENDSSGGNICPKGVQI